MTIQRIGTTEGVKELYGVKLIPLISLVVVHNGIVSTCGVTAEPPPHPESPAATSVTNNIAMSDA